MQTHHTLEVSMLHPHSVEFEDSRVELGPEHQRYALSPIDQPLIEPADFNDQGFGVVSQTERITSFEEPSTNPGIPNQLPLVTPNRNGLVPAVLQPIASVLKMSRSAELTEIDLQSAFDGGCHGKYSLYCSIPASNKFSGPLEEESIH